jgi:hypothetical protein
MLEYVMKVSVISISIFIFDNLLPLGQPSTTELTAPKEGEKNVV